MIQSGLKGLLRIWGERLRWAGAAMILMGFALGLVCSVLVVVQRFENSRPPDAPAHMRLPTAIHEGWSLDPDGGVTFGRWLVRLKPRPDVYAFGRAESARIALIGRSLERAAFVEVRESVTGPAEQSAMKDVLKAALPGTTVIGWKQVNESGSRRRFVSEATVEGEDGRFHAVMDCETSGTLNIYAYSRRDSLARAIRDVEMAEW